jgi:hypothetical protein
MGLAFSSHSMVSSLRPDVHVSVKIARGEKIQRTHETGIKILVADAIKRKDPNQSTRFNCSIKGADFVWWSLRNSVTMIYPSPTIGRFIQNIQRHETIK